MLFSRYLYGLLPPFHKSLLKCHLPQIYYLKMHLSFYKPYLLLFSPHSICHHPTLYYISLLSSHTKTWDMWRQGLCLACLFFYVHHLEEPLIHNRFWTNICWINGWVDREGDFYIFLGALFNIASGSVNIYSFCLFIYQTNLFCMPLCPRHSIFQLVEK